MQLNGPQHLELAQIDRRFDKFRLTSPLELQKLHASVKSEGRIRDPVRVSAGVEDKCLVLMDGFKRLRVAEDLGVTHLWVQVVQLDAVHAKAAILLLNPAQQGLSELEEAWIVQSLCKEHGMKQAEVAQLLQRHQSWVSRRQKLIETLEEGLQNDVRLGLLSASTARELSLMPRGIQLQAAQAVRDHQLSSRQTVLLVKRLREASDPRAVGQVLEDPLRYIAAEGAKRAGVGGNDPRLSEAGNQLRQALLNWKGSCGSLARELGRSHLTADEAHVLAPALKSALQAGKRAVRQLAAIHKACDGQGLAAQDEPAPSQEDKDA